MYPETARVRPGNSIAKSTSINGANDTFNPKKTGDYNGNGLLQPMAAMMLITLLYPCRYARFDALKAIGFLAKCITRWDGKSDARLHQLMCYLRTTLSHRTMGYIGDDPTRLTLHLYCDADFAGCPFTLKSTNGVHADLEGPNTRFAWAGGSRGQTMTAQSTPEAELISLSEGLKDKGEPALLIWHTILRQYHHDDAGWQA